MPSDSKYRHVSRTLLNILADLDSSLIQMISNLPLIFSSSIFFFWFFGTVPSTLTTIGITVNLTFHGFSALLQDPSTFPFIFTLWSASKTTRGLVLSYGISTIVGYLMPNPVYSYIVDIWFVNISVLFTDSLFRLFNVKSRKLVRVGSYPSTEMQSVYSTTLTDWGPTWRKVFFFLIINNDLIFCLGSDDFVIFGFVK